MPTAKKLISLRSSYIQPTLQLHSAEWKRRDKSLSYSKTKNWPWCQRLCNGQTRDFYKTNIQLLEITTSTCTSLQRSTRRETKIAKNTGTSEIRLSLPSNHRSIKRLQELMALNSMRSRVLRSSLRDLPRPERRLSGRRWWLREVHSVPPRESRMPENRQIRRKKIQTSTSQQLRPRSSQQDLVEWMALKSFLQETKNTNNWTESAHLYTCQSLHLSKSQNQLWWRRNHPLQ